MGDVVVREMRFGDRDGITALFEATWEHDDYPISAKSIRDVRSIIWYTAMTKQWVAVDRRRVVGHIAVRSAEGYIYGPTFAAIMGVPIGDVSVICRFAVHPNYRRRGIARQLFEAVTRSEGRCAFDAVDMSKADEVFYRSIGLFPIDQVDRVKGDEHHLTTLWVDGVRPGWQPRRAGDLPLTQ